MSAPQPARPPMTSGFDARAFLEDYLRSISAGQLDQLDRFLRPGYFEEYPQSGERIRGVENVVAAVRAYPGGPPGAGIELGTTRIVELEQGYAMTPAFTMVRLAGTGDVLTGVARTRYPDGSIWWIVSLITFAERQLVRQVAYFAPEFEAPAWRASYVERFAPLARIEVSPSMPSAASEPVDARRHFEAWVDAINAKRYEELLTLTHPEFVVEWPQSGELVTSPEKLVAIMQVHPSLRGSSVDRPSLQTPDEGWLLTPMYTLVRVAGTGDTRTATFRVNYPDGSRWWVITIVTFQGQRAVRATTFWAPEFEAPAWRAPFVERYEP